MEQTLAQINPTIDTHPRAEKLATLGYVLPLMGLFLIPIFIGIVGYDYHLLETIYPTLLIYLYAGLTLIGPLFAIGAWIQCARLGRLFLSHAIAGTIVNILTLIVFGFVVIIAYIASFASSY